MLKFIYKIIDKINNWIQKQEQDYIEFLVQDFCKVLQEKYNDLVFKCYYFNNTFVFHINERYINHNVFNDYMKNFRDSFVKLFPDYTLLWSNYNPVNDLYYNKKKHKLLYSTR